MRYTKDWDYIQIREWDEHVTRMPSCRLVRVVRDGIPNRRRSPGRSGAALNLNKQAISL